MTLNSVGCQTFKGIQGIYREAEDRRARSRVGGRARNVQGKYRGEKTMWCANSVAENGTTDFARSIERAFRGAGPSPFAVSSSILANLPIESFRKG